MSAEPRAARVPVHRLRKRKRRGSYYQVPGGPRLALIGAYLGTWLAIAGGIALCIAIGGDALDLLN